MKNVYLIIVLSTLLIIAFTTSASAGWIIFHKQEFRGKVIDAETKEPIEGAVVVATYQKYPIISGPGGGSPSIVKIKETLTDKKGEFYFPRYTTIIQPLAREVETVFIIFKPGYGSHPWRQVPPLVSPRGVFFKGIRNQGRKRFQVKDYIIHLRGSGAAKEEDQRGEAQGDTKATRRCQIKRITPFI